MSNLAHRQQKIQEKRKETPWRQFVMEICSWVPLIFYKNNNKASRYPEDGRVKALCTSKEFIDSMDKQIDGHYTGSFLDKYKKLFEDAPLPMLLESNTENCNYADNVRFVKNVYLSFAVVLDCNNILYSIHIKENCNNVLNSLMVWDGCENVFQSKGIIKSVNVFYSSCIYNCSHIWFSDNLVGYHECINCENLENCSYRIDNIQYSKEEYVVKKKEILIRLNSEPKMIFSKESLKLGSTDCSNSGFCINSEHIVNGYNTYNVKNGRNLFDVGSSGGNEFVYDCIIAGSPHGRHFYGCLYSGPGEHIYCCEAVAGGQNNYYSYFLLDCSFCLGCIGLRNKSYCILNKQYTKEERYEKVDEIFAQMDADGTLGAFFPATMNPFYFNDTAAYLIDPSFTKEEVTAKGYLRRDDPIKVDIPAGVQTVKTSELGQYEARRPHPSPLPKEEGDSPVSQRGEPEEGQHRRIDPEIMKKVIIDEEGNAYRIIPMEYEFLMKHGLPLPRKHRLDRMKENFRIS